VRIRRSRALIAFAIVTTHVGVIVFYSAARAPIESQRSEAAPFTVLMLPQMPMTDGGGGARTQPTPSKPGHAARKTLPPRAPSAVEQAPEPDSRQATPPLIDWADEAKNAARDQIAADDEKLRLASALSRWKSNVMPAPKVPAASTFGWDEARLHRFTSTPLGLVVNLGDYCSLVISPLAIGGGCAFGKPPSRGDLFEHMRDPQ
jgi:hypothetical protein